MASCKTQESKRRARRSITRHIAIEEILVNEIV